MKSATDNKMKFCSKEKLSAYYYRKATELYNAKEFIFAINYYNKVIAFFPNSAPAHYWRANSFLELNDFFNACSDAKKALELGNEQSKSIIKKTCVE